MVKAFKILRIICCVLSAACVAACVFMFVLVGPFWGAMTVGMAFLFFVLMILFRYLQQNAEIKEFPPEPKGDFITGPVKKDEDNKE